MNILITGGAGFIGSHLAQKLIKQGHKVYAVDNLSTGREENIEDIKDNLLFSFTKGSVLNASLMEELIGKCELVYHLAAAVGVEYIMSNRLKTFEVNVMGTHIVLEAASRSSDHPENRGKGKKKVMIASSLVAKGYVTKLFKNTQPYSQGEIAEMLTELDKEAQEGSLKLSKVEEQRLNLLKALSQKDYLFQMQGEKHLFGVDFGVGENIIHRRQESDENKTGYATLFRPTVEGQIKDDFAFRSDLKVYYLSATQFPDIPKTEVRMSQPAKETQTASLSNYYIKANLPWFSILFGHDNIHWGPGCRGALLVSEHPLPMNMLKLQAQYYPVKFQSVTARLGGDLDKKYLSGHRLEFNLWDKLRLGIAETVVYGHRFEMVYLNPVQIYTTTEFVFPEAVGENDNVLISGDLDIVPLRNLELYGEVMIDDYRPFSYSPKNWGNKFGLLFGVRFLNDAEESATKERVIDLAKQRIDFAR